MIKKTTRITICFARLQMNLTLEVPNFKAHNWRNGKIHNNGGKSGYQNPLEDCLYNKSGIDSIFNF